MDFSNYFEFLRYGIVILKNNISEKLLLLKYKIFFILRKLIRIIIQNQSYDVSFLNFFQIFYRGKKKYQRLNIFSFSFRKILLFLSKKKILSFDYTANENPAIFFSIEYIQLNA